MSDVFIVNLFYFQINKNITIFCCIDSTFYRYARIYDQTICDQTNDIEYHACNLHIQQQLFNPFSIFYNISILVF